MFRYGDDIEENEKEIDEIICPFCKLRFYAHVIRDYAGYHNREVLIHCDNEDCDNLYILVYKFSHVIKLNKDKEEMS